MRIEEGKYNVRVDMLMNVINALETKFYYNEINILRTGGRGRKTI